MKNKRRVKNISSCYFFIFFNKKAYKKIIKVIKLSIYDEIILVLKKSKLFKTSIKKITSIKELELKKLNFFGKKGVFAKIFKKISFLSLLERKKWSAEVNTIKKEIQYLIESKKNEILKLSLKNKINSEKIDVTLPSKRFNIGSIHPINKTIYEIEDYFSQMGFNLIASNFEIEDEYHNFDALNIPKDHPARESHDTFWINNNYLLRTQMSSMQIRILKKNKFPAKILVSGKAYRNDYDTKHTPMFHQIEGIVIDKKINFSNLKWIINSFIDYFFKEKVTKRFRNSFFPFTVPSMEVDILKKEKYWIEILGCGMIHPVILKKINVSSEDYQGFAFGMGVERLVMLRNKITDIRLFFENDLRFLKQFK
ncbi:phenylalanine--tRNA ligase subunit alpha [Buchnera aphidicola]|uniref:phenylalanine--tRNA ligase subunit alpha n=1 Tax=Buchnera aphidicola TaxID=9 RepID=UPI0031B6BEE6